MVASVLRAAIPPLITVVTLPIILDRVSLSNYGLWATITGLIAVLATIDGGLATEVTRRVAAARGDNDMPRVVESGRQGVGMVLGLAVVVMPLTALAGLVVVRWIAPAEDYRLGVALWIGIVVYQTIGWYYAVLAGVVTGLQRGDLTNTVNAVGAVAGALATVTAVLVGMGVWGLFVGLIVLGLVTTAGHMRTTRRLTGTSTVWLPMRPDRVRALLLASLALASMQASLLVEPAAAKALLSAFDGPESAAAMQLAFTVTRLALVAAMAPTATILVGVSEWRDSQPERIVGLVRNASYASLALVGVLAVVMLATGPYVADAWLGQNVPGLGLAIRALSPVAVLTIVVWLFTQTLLGHGNTRPVTLRLLTGSVVALALMAMAAPTVGIGGVIAASAVGATVSAVSLGRIDGEFEGIIWKAALRMGPALMLLGLAGAWVVDRFNPQERLAAALAAIVMAVLAGATAWLLLPRDTRLLIRTTVHDRLPGRA